MQYEHLHDCTHDFGGLFRQALETRVNVNENETSAPHSPLLALTDDSNSPCRLLDPLECTAGHSPVRSFASQALNNAPAMAVEHQFQPEVNTTPRTTFQLVEQTPTWQTHANSCWAPWTAHEFQDINSDLMAKTISVLGDQGVRFHWEALRWDSLQPSEVVRSYITKNRRDKITELFHQRMKCTSELGKPKAGCVFFYPKDKKTNADLGVWIIADPRSGFHPAKIVADLDVLPPICQAGWEESGPRKKEGQTFKGEGFRAWIKKKYPNYLFLSPETQGRTAKRRATPSSAAAQSSTITNQSADWFRYNPLANAPVPEDLAILVPQLLLGVTPPPPILEFPLDCELLIDHHSLCPGA